MKGKRNVAEIKDFSGGLITKAAPKGLDPKFSVDCMNVYAEGATLRPRNGFTTVNGTTAAQIGYGVFNWWQSGTSQWLVMFSGATLAKMDVVGGVWDGVLDTLTFDAASGTAFSAGTMHFVTYGSTLIMTTEARNVPQRMTVGDASYKNLVTGGGGTAPNAKFCQVWKNHCWLLNTGTYEDRIQRSAINTFSDWTGPDSGYNDIITPGDVGLTGSAVMSKSMYVWKSWSIHRFTYLGAGGVLVDIREVKNVIGTKSPKTIKTINVPGKGELSIFLGTDRKLYLFDGNFTEPISDRCATSNGVSLISFDSINQATLSKAWALINTQKNWYELFICMGTSTTINYSITYDYVSDSFWPNDNRTFTAGVISDDGSGGQRKSYAQDASNNFLYQLDTGFADSTTAINAYWVSSKIGQSMTLEKFDEIEVETKATTCAPTFSWRADWETTWITQSLASGRNSYNFSPSRLDNLIQFKFADVSTTDRFSLWSIQLNNRVLGIGK